MAVPVARVHLKMAHAALPALLPSPPNWKMLQLLPTPCVAANLPKPLAKPGRADANERWDTRKIKPASAKPSASSSASALCSADSVVRSIAGHGSSHSQRKNATSPPPKLPKPGRADSVERWDAHKKAAASPASSSSPSSLASSSKWPISHAERWDAHKKRCPRPLDDGESSSNDMDTEEEILWKPRAMYAGPGFVVAAPQPSTIPMPTAFLVPVA